MTKRPNINHITSADLRDSERLADLYCQAVKRKYWPNSTRALLDFFALAEKAQDDDRRGTPETLFAWQVKHKHTVTITDAQEIRAERKLLQIDKYATVELAEDLLNPKSGWHIRADLGESREIIADSEIAFVPAVMTQVFFPQIRPSIDQEFYKSRHGDAAVLVRRGFLIKPDQPGFEEHKLCQIPSGSKSRIILPYIVTEAIRTKSRTVNMGHSLRQFMKSVGMPITGRNAKEITQQVENIAAASIIFGYWGEDYAVQRNEYIVSAIDFWIDKNERQLTIWPPTLELSQNFYELIQMSNVPFRMDHLVRLRTPRRKDLYLWLCYRAPRIPKGKPLVIKLDALQRIFAPHVTSMKNFKQYFKRDLQTIWREFHHFKVEIKGDVLMVYHSPPIVKPKTVISG